MDFRLHQPACFMRLIQNMLCIFWARSTYPPRLPAQPPMVPGHDRWLGGEAGRVGGARPKIAKRALDQAHKAQGYLDNPSDLPGDEQFDLVAGDAEVAQAMVVEPFEDRDRMGAFPVAGDGGDESADHGGVFL